MPGREIERNAHGRPTGKLFGNIGSFPALFTRALAPGDEERKKVWRDFDRLLVTAVVERGVRRVRKRPLRFFVRPLAGA
jgi:hypothetical protein